MVEEQTVWLGLARDLILTCPLITKTGLQEALCKIDALLRLSYIYRCKRHEKEQLEKEFCIDRGGEKGHCFLH